MTTNDTAAEIQEQKNKQNEELISTTKELIKEILPEKENEIEKINKNLNSIKQEIQGIIKELKDKLKDNKNSSEIKQINALIAKYEKLLDKADKHNTEFYKDIAMTINGTESKQTSEYRTKIKAGKTSEVPDKVALTTLKNYQNAVGLYQDGNAFLQPFDKENMSGLIFKEGHLYFEDSEQFEGMRAISEAELKNFYTKKSIDKIDLPLLRTFYSVIFKEFEKSGYQTVPEVVTMYAPEMMKILGITQKIGKDPTNEKSSINALIVKTYEFHNIVGIIKTRYGNSYYPVMNFSGYDSETNTISFSSPYFCKILKTILQKAIKMDKKGQHKLLPNGKPDTYPSYSFLIHADIASERNKGAVEIVHIIVQIIEQAGNNTANVKFSTLIERCPQFQQRYETDTHKQRLLERTFQKVWELLKTKTDIGIRYKEFEFPDPNNPKNIPTPKTLDTVIYFKHKGKIK